MPNHSVLMLINYLCLGCPAILRCDYRTEDCILAATQCALRLPHVDDLAGRKSFIYGQHHRYT